MPAAAQWIDDLTFRDEIVKYVTAKCLRWRVKRADIDDLVQEVFAQIIASIATFRPEKGTFDKWARGIARNVIRKYLRDARQYVECFSEYHPNVDEHAAPDPSPERCEQRREARCSISNAVEKLDPKQAQVLELFVLDDMSHRDIGQTLNMSESASQKCYQRTLNKLAQCIDVDLLSAMPPIVSGCDEPASTHNVGSRWHERSHYAGQVAAAIAAFLLFIPPNQTTVSHASVIGKISTTGIVQNALMYQQDKRSVRQDEPAVHHGAPVGKPEPASLPSVHVVPARTRVVDKPAPIQQPLPQPSFKPTVRPSAHRPRGRR